MRRAANTAKPTFEICPPTVSKIKTPDISIQGTDDQIETIQATFVYLRRFNASSAVHQLKIYCYVGKCLSHMKREQGRGRWMSFCRDYLPFSSSQASRYIKISKNEEELKRKIVNHNHDFELTILTLCNLISPDREPKPASKPNSTRPANRSEPLQSTTKCSTQSVRTITKPIADAKQGSTQKPTSKSKVQTKPPTDEMKTVKTQQERRLQFCNEFDWDKWDPLAEIPEPLVGCWNINDMPDRLFQQCLSNCITQLKKNGESNISIINSLRMNY